MKKVLSFAVLLISLFHLSAQNTIVPVGGTAIGSNGSITYTVGQIAIQKSDDGTISILEGVQLPYEIQTVGIDDYPYITLNAIVYPNPTQDVVQLLISNFDIPTEGLIAQLYDNNGRQLQIISISDLETRIDLGSYATALYQLRIMYGKQLLKAFKIVKNNF